MLATKPALEVVGAASALISPLLSVSVSPSWLPRCPPLLAHTAVSQAPNVIDRQFTVLNVSVAGEEVFRVSGDGHVNLLRSSTLGESNYTTVAYLVYNVVYAGTGMQDTIRFEGVIGDEYPLVFEGEAEDEHQIFLGIDELTADRFIHLPDRSGQVLVVPCTS